MKTTLRFSLIKVVQPGEMLPAFYGVAWRDFLSNRAVCLPMPFNTLAAGARGLWLFCRYGYLRVDLNPRDAFHQGRIYERKGRR